MSRLQDYVHFLLSFYQKRLTINYIKHMPIQKTRRGKRFIIVYNKTERKKKEKQQTQLQKKQIAQYLQISYK